MVMPQLIELYKNKSLSGDSGTETFPIKRTHQILGLYLSVRAKNGATRNSPDAAALQTVEEALEKIEVKSGSTTIKSYTGEICRRLAAYRDGKMPYALYTQNPGGTWAGNDDPALGWQEYLFPINFTPRQDPYGVRTGCCLPAPLYDSLDLVIDYDFTISATAGFVTGGSNHVFNMHALVLPAEDPTVMRTKRILVETKKQDYTTVASGDKSIELTLDKKRWLRQALVFCYENGIGEGVDVTDMKLNINADTYWSGRWGTLQKLNAANCNLDYRQQFYLQAASTTDELWTRIPAPIPKMIAGTAPTVAPYFGTLGNGDKVTVTTDAQDDINLMEVRSDVLPACAIFDFDVDGQMLGMPSCNQQDMEIVLTQGGAGGTVQVIEQHVALPWNV